MGTCAKESVPTYFIGKHETNKTITIHLNYIIYWCLGKICIHLISQYFQPIGSFSRGTLEEGSKYLQLSRREQVDLTTQVTCRNLSGHVRTALSPYKPELPLINPLHRFVRSACQPFDTFTFWSGSSRLNSLNLLFKMEICYDFISI